MYPVFVVNHSPKILDGFDWIRTQLTTMVDKHFKDPDKKLRFYFIKTMIQILNDKFIDAINAINPNKNTRFHGHRQDVGKRITKKEKDVFFGVVVMVGELYLKGLIHEKIIFMGILTKLTSNNAKETEIEGCCRLFRICGKELDRKKRDKVTSVLKKLKELSRKQTFRLRVLVDEILQMRERNWVPIQKKDETELKNNNGNNDNFGTANNDTKINDVDSNEIAIDIALIKRALVVVNDLKQKQDTLGEHEKSKLNRLRSNIEKYQELIQIYGDIIIAKREGQNIGASEQILVQLKQYRELIKKDVDANCDNNNNNNNNNSNGGNIQVSSFEFNNDEIPKIQDDVKLHESIEGVDDDIRDLESHIRDEELRLDVLDKIDNEKKINSEMFNHTNVKMWNVYHVISFIINDLNMKEQYINILYNNNIDGKTLINNLSRNKMISMGFDKNDVTLILSNVNNLKFLTKFQRSIKTKNKGNNNTNENSKRPPLSQQNANKLEANNIEIVHDPNYIPEWLKKDKNSQNDSIIIDKKNEEIMILKMEVAKYKKLEQMYKNKMLQSKQTNYYSIYTENELNNPSLNLNNLFEIQNSLLQSLKNVSNIIQQKCNSQD